MDYQSKAKLQSKSNSNEQGLNMKSFWMLPLCIQITIAYSTEYNRFL